MKTKTKNGRLEQWLVSLHSECHELLGAMQDGLDDIPAPDKCNWGHVGQLTRVRDLLKEAKSTMPVG